MKKLSDTYKELGIAFTFPIEITDANGNRTYYENKYGFWKRTEYDADANGNRTYYENSNGYWYRTEYNADGQKTYFEDNSDYWERREFDDNDKMTYYENSEGYEEGTKRSSCTGKVIEVDSKKYKLTEL